MSAVPDLATLKKLKVQELKDLLLERSLAVAGKKEDLIQRLVDHAEQPSSTPKGLTVETAPNVTAASLKSPSDKSPVRAPESSALKNADSTNTGIEPEVVTKPSGFTFRKLSFDAGTAPAPAQTSPTVSGKGPTSPLKKAAPTPSVASNVSNGKRATATTTTAVPALSAEDLEKRKQRAARFGLPATEKDKLAERALRFGAASGASSTAVASTSPAPSPTTPTATAASSATSVKDIEEEKKRKRAERFGAAPVVETPTAITPAVKKVKT